LHPRGLHRKFAWMRALLPLLLAACVGSAPAASSAVPDRVAAPDPRVEIGVASGLDKLRPGDSIPRAREISLVAARGECESAQIAVRPAAPLAALSAAAAPLAGPARVPVALHRVATLSLPRGSGPEGAPGEWPDPLVPVKDAFFGEARRAFPVEVPARRLQAIWVEVCVPAEAPAGEYRGEVRLRDGERALANVPVLLRVWPFALPATGTFTAAFGLPTRVGTRMLGNPDDPELARALAASLQRHRISPYTHSADPPDGTCTARRCELDWTRFDGEVGPVLDGTLVPGVKGTFAEVRIAAKVWDGPEADLAATLRAWKRHFDARGWSDRLWLYTLDEPRPEQFPELRRRARLAREAGIRVFATIVPDPALAGAVDAFAPNLVLVRDRAQRKDGVSFSYASCMSHGCDEIPASGRTRETMLREFRGWPGYVIDRPGAAARAVPWLGWRRGLDGELYYDVLHAWIAGDPWKDVRAFAGNGDGTLLYPGRPAELGGTHGFPVESIRLKIIRDALEDLELLRMAEAAGLGPLARTTAAKLVPSARGFERDPRRWLEARAALGDALARRKIQAAR
jgi:Glycoside hydrolase 123, catalytic domain